MRIQAFVRGFVRRALYRRLLRSFFNSGGGDMDRRREYVANELDQVGSKLLSALTVSVFLEH